MFLAGLTLASCTLNPTNESKKTSMSVESADSTSNKSYVHTNELINQSSPYLLQHAHNPVNWYPWGEEALTKAKKEQKPILVSIGYAACHWCHVMEHESFENEEVADLMNKYFVCVKVDREERPDVDDIYMSALHLMGQQGGWPLNVFLTPDQKPFYGGTYFPRKNWQSVIEQLHEAFINQRPKIESSAEQLTKGINSNQSYLVQVDRTKPISLKELKGGYESIAKRFDPKNGGMGNAPKFPMPSIYNYLLNYESIAQEAQAKTIVNTTLSKMAFGGIYDQVGGGFARYSTDDHWLAPHFEKMLYDNAQLISLYSKAYRQTNDPTYRQVVFETIEFCERELQGKHGNFFSSLDADSEGEEGKFYVWTKDELKEVLGKQFELFSEYYKIPHSSAGNWEGNIILERNEHFSSPIADDVVKSWKAKLLKERSKRIRPGLDDKTLTGWNGLMLKGLCDSYRSFGHAPHLKLALKNASFLRKSMTDKNGHLHRNYKNGTSNIDAFLEDYAAAIDGYLALYEITFDEQWIDEANKLMTYVFNQFYDEKDHFFYFTDKDGPDLIARKKEVQDNVIPASNSIMARNLLRLGVILDRNDYKEIGSEMAYKMKESSLKQTSFMANWAVLLSELQQPMAEIVIVGPKYNELRSEFQKRSVPYAIFMGAEKSSDLPLLQRKIAVGGKTTIYVCFDKACKLPVHSVAEAVKLLGK